MCWKPSPRSMKSTARLLRRPARPFARRTGHAASAAWAQCHARTLTCVIAATRVLRYESSNMWRVG